MCVRMLYWDWWYNVLLFNMWRSTSYERGLDGWYKMWWSNIWWYKSRVWDSGFGIDDIMCDDIACDDLHLASVAGMDDITCDDLTYDDLNPEYEIMGLGLMI